MANTNDDEELDDLASLPPEQLSDELARDIAKRWDPERLLKLVAARAGKGGQFDHTLRERYEKPRGHAAPLVLAPFHRNAGYGDKALLAHELTHVAQAEKGVHRAGHGTDLVLASEEHEAEAEAAEAQAAAEHKGEAQTQGAGHAKHEQGAAKKQNTEKLREEIKEKVLEMLGEWGRVEEMRSGHAMRRP